LILVPAGAGRRSNRRPSELQLRRAFFVSSSDFLQITARAESGKNERLFRASISAFCSLTRPSRREIGQLEDLTLPLFDSVSAEGLRFAAAALSECEYAPEALVRRLCEASVDVAAPLLVRSRALTDIDLIALIGRHGLPHARAIARRRNLNPTIASLVRALERPTLVRQNGRAPGPTAEQEKADRPMAMVRQERAAGMAAEAVRARLRGMMLGERLRSAGIRDDSNPADRSSAYAKLRETALTGNAAFFQTALADALDLDFTTARSLVSASDPSMLLTALRALDLSEDKAFLIAVAVFPKHFPHPQAIRLFLDKYRLMHHDAALERMRLLKADAAAQAIVGARQATANTDERPRPSVLKAS
jgi:uncharacterized protein (DUF2336 family)